MCLFYSFFEVTDPRNLGISNSRPSRQRALCFILVSMRVPEWQTSRHHQPPARRHRERIVFIVIAAAPPLRRRRLGRLCYPTRPWTSKRPWAGGRGFVLVRRLQHSSVTTRATTRNKWTAVLDATTESWRTCVVQRSGVTGSNFQATDKLCLDIPHWDPGKFFPV